jgi:hypothetical protein
MSVKIHVLTDPDRRAEFLTSVAEKCDVIVIERSDLPRVEVEPVYNGPRVASGGWKGAAQAQTREAAEAGVLAWAALVDWFDTRPAVKAEDVCALADLLSRADTHDLRTSYEEDARALLATGRVMVTP